MAVQNVRILPFINTYARITSKFWEDRGGIPHRGVDLAGISGNVPLYSMVDGVVIVSRWNNSYGNYIIIKGDNGLGFLYGHMHEVNVRLNERVINGQQVGLQGTTGTSTGNHLHLEMQDISNRSWRFTDIRSDYLNPAEWIGYDEIIGDDLYYDGTPIPPTPTIKKNKFKWVLYARKLREKRLN